LTEEETIFIFKELKDAFLAMYNENIIHRDIKPDNIMIHNSNIKISDFGFTRTLDSDEMVFFKKKILNFYKI